ncbi:MAG: hypothetical protein PHU08_05330 [Dehalococcoidales bacterium]|nr:hypothetical protein [Dehalococcoidales bacterium]
MSRLRLLFIVSLVILAGAFVATMYWLPSASDATESGKAQIIARDNEWILQYDITNQEDRDIQYTIIVTVDNNVYEDTAVVKPGKVYTYIHHIYPQQSTDGKVTLALYEEGKTEPIDQVTYYLK